MIRLEWHLTGIINASNELYFLFLLLLLTVMIFIKRKFQPECRNILYALNTWIFWVCLVQAGFLARQLWIAWYAQNAYEQWAFYEHPNLLGLTSAQWLYFSYAVSLIFLIFIIRRWRAAIAPTLIFVVIKYLPAILIWIFASTKDMLPSGWQKPSGYVFWRIVYFSAALLFFTLIYWITYKRSRLPYPSLFLKPDVQ